MNFLAHIYLSGSDDLLMIGNFIADHIKGKAFDNLNARVKEGVILHRKIDQFTDAHPIVHQSKERLRPKFHKYSPVVADVFYDHFLAANWKNYSEISLPEFAQNFYRTTEQNLHLIPERTKRMLPYMISNDWLVSYASISGINNVMKGMARRTSFESGMEHSAIELEKNYLLYEKEFKSFFTELQDFTSDELNRIRKI